MGVAGPALGRRATLAAAVHVYGAPRPPGATAPADADWALLDAAERDTAGRLVFARDRESYVRAHALLRRTLAGYGPTPPAALAFSRGGHGRPELLGEPPAAPLRFSLSHTAGLAACAVTLGLDVGLDVECVRPQANLAALAESTLAAAELRTLMDLPPERQDGHFYALWTLKEAYAKARGFGLALPLTAAAFHLDDPAASIVFAPAAALGDTADAWQFGLFWPTAEHVAAVAVRRGAGPDRAIVWRG